MPKYVLDAVSQILRPIIRWLISSDILFPNLNNLIKTLYVESAVQILGTDNRHTVSQIALMTGLHRKEIKEILDNSPNVSPKKMRSPIKARLMAQWLSCTFAIDTEGKPIALPEKGENSFETIAKLVSKDVAAGSILRNGLRERYMQRLENNMIKLNLQALGGNATNEDDIYFLGANVGDHISASLNNIEGKKEKRFERAVYAEQIDPKLIRKLRDTSSEKALELIMEINRLTVDSETRVDTKPKNRFRFGFYFYDDTDN